MNDRDRLFGVIAVQWGLLSQEEFAEYSKNASKHANALASTIATEKRLSARDQQAVEWMVERSLASDNQSAEFAATIIKPQLHDAKDGSTKRPDASMDTDGPAEVSTAQFSAAPRNVETPEAGGKDLGSDFVSDPESIQPAFDETVIQDKETQPRSPFQGRPTEGYDRQGIHAKGGIGQVWRATEKSIDRTVALKELLPSRANNEAYRSRFLVEAKITGQLQHPGVVPVYELRDEDSASFYTMRFIEGDTLHAAIRLHHQQRTEGQAQSLNQTALLNAFIGVCNTIDYAHSRGVIHRDLKGQNVVLGEFGEVIVLDWGLARRLETTQLKTVFYQAR
jgi:eukaryotic-like serine/threonine-protein kinase